MNRAPKKGYEFVRERPEAMFTPPAFAMESQAALRAHCARHDFGFLVLSGATPTDPPQTTALPMLIDGPDEAPVLIAHVARANGIWRAFDGEHAAVALFPGPHAYISPHWYAGDPAQAVPTWNYTLVQATGRPRAVDDPVRAQEILHALSQSQEPGEGGWRPDGPAQATVTRMLPGIVAFEMPVESLTGKAKLSQNRKAVDREGVIAGLRASGAYDALAVADLMASLDIEGGSG